MDKSPRRPQTMLTVAQMLFAEKDESFGLVILSETRRAIEKTQVDEPMFYWIFMNSYAKHIPADTAAVFKEALAGLNGIKPQSPDAGFWWSGLSHELRPLPMTPEIMDLEPQYVSASVKLLESPKERTAVRLNLLRGALKRYEREKAEGLEKRQTSPAKTKSRDTAGPSSN